MDEDHKKKGDIGEEYVNNIAYNSFIKFWCFPNPKDENGNKKEICDLLVLFDKICIIISVKNYSFKGDHKRYFKKTIDKAISQIYGAERKLFASSHQISFIHPDRGNYDFNPKNFAKVFRVIINLGEGELFYIIGSDEVNKEFIHIFNKESFDILFLELDTISDFAEYIEKREKLFKRKDVLVLSGPDEAFTPEANIEFLQFSTLRDIQNKKSITITGSEKDLLAHYLRYNRDFSASIKSDEYTLMSLDLEGEWEEYIKSEKVKAKKNEDDKSYFIDEIVKRELINLTNGNEIAKVLLSFNRFERRLASKTLLSFYEKYNDSANRKYFMAKRYTELKNWGIVCFIYSADIDDKVVEFAMDLAVDGFSLRTQHKMKNILCIATRANMTQFKFTITEIEPFSKDKIEQVEEDCKRLNWFQDLKKIEFNEKEYPD